MCPASASKGEWPADIKRSPHECTHALALHTMTMTAFLRRLHTAQSVYDIFDYVFLDVFSSFLTFFIFSSEAWFLSLIGALECFIVE